VGHSQRERQLIRLGSATCVGLAGLAFEPHRPSPGQDRPIGHDRRTSVATVFEGIGRRQLDARSENIEGLIRITPNFRCSLIKGDCCWRRPPHRNHRRAPTGRTRTSKARARRSCASSLPGALSETGCRATSCNCAAIRDTLVVDTRPLAALLYERAARPFCCRLHVSSGRTAPEGPRGPKKTPIGVYQITASLPRQS